MSAPNHPDSQESNKPARTRREFLRGAAATGAGIALGLPALAQQEMTQVRPPTSAPGTIGQMVPVSQPSTTSAESQKLRLAHVAVGGIAGYHLERSDKMGVTVPCFADVDTRQYKRFAETYPQARTYTDYREMFDRQHKDFDAVMIATPDHHHYPATMIAMQLGKHVYTQKPLTHTVWEARQLRLMSEKNPKLITQMGNQGHSAEGWRLVYEWIRGGALGDITVVHTWSDRPIWPQGMNRPDAEKEQPAPSELNWDVWLGPAPVRPFVPEAYHPFNWRGWWDFGTGALGDMACHTMDGLFFVLEPGHASQIEPLASTPTTAEAFPKASIARWTFPARGDRPEFKAYWYDGGLRPPFPEELEAGRTLPGTGNLFVGTKGKMLVAGDYGNSPRIIPEERMKEIGKPQPLLERSPGQVEEWILACKGERPIESVLSHFRYAGPMTEALMLGNIALRVGRRLEWDGEKMEFPNLPDANQYVSKEYRSGWKF